MDTKTDTKSVNKSIDRLVRLSLITEGKQVYLDRKRGEKGPIPTLASNSKLLFCNELQLPAEASASEIITGLELSNYSGITRPSLATTGFAARLV